MNAHFGISRNIKILKTWLTTSTFHVTHLETPMFLKNKTPKPSPVCAKSFGRAELAEFGAESVATFASASWRGGSSSADPNGKSLPGVACFLGLYVCFQVFWKSYHLGWFEVPNGILKLPWWLNTAWATFQKDTNKSKKNNRSLGDLVKQHSQTA